MGDGSPHVSDLGVQLQLQLLAARRCSNSVFDSDTSSSPLRSLSFDAQCGSCLQIFAPHERSSPGPSSGAAEAIAAVHLAILLAADRAACTDT